MLTNDLSKVNITFFCMKYCLLLVTNARVVIFIGLGIGLW
jgi:hypothetical protein